MRPVVRRLAASGDETVTSQELRHRTAIQPRPLACWNLINVSSIAGGLWLPVARTQQSLNIALPMKQIHCLKITGFGPDRQAIRQRTWLHQCHGYSRPNIARPKYYHSPVSIKLVMFPSYTPQPVPSLFQNSDGLKASTHFFSLNHTSSIALRGVSFSLESHYI